MSRKKASFTLIEMLIVIAIIAILMALVLPAASGARRRAQAVKCAANLRQIGIAIKTYANDTGRYPLGFCGGACAAAFPARAGEWSYSLNEYLGGNALAGWSTPGQRSPVIQCPSAPKRNQNIESHYSAHPGILVDPDWDPPERFPDGGFPYTAFKRPTDIVLVLDGQRHQWSTDADATFMRVAAADAAWSGVQADSEKPADEGQPDKFVDHNSENLPDGDHWPAWRHDGAMNTLRVDGHVESLKLVGTDGVCEFKEKHVRYNY